MWHGTKLKGSYHFRGVGLASMANGPPPLQREGETFVRPIHDFYFKIEHIEPMT